MAIQAHEQIRQMILDGRLATRSVVSEAELVRVLGVSRTPIREALHRLEAASYVRQLPGGGYVVVELRQEDMVNVYQVRAVLEGLAAEGAARSATRTDIGRLEDLFEAMEVAEARKDDVELANLNGQFHRAIAIASGNTYVLAMLDDIRDVFERLRATALTQQQRRGASHAEHRELIECIREHDELRAKKAAIQHVERALQFQLSRQKKTQP